MKLRIKVDGIDGDLCRANRHVLWGWKRDSGARQRVIAFGASLGSINSGRIDLEDWFLSYRSRAAEHELLPSFESLCAPEVRREIGLPFMRRCPRTGLAILELSGGPGLSRNASLVERLRRRRPRLSIPRGTHPQPTRSRVRLDTLAPIAAYVGSGLSYESGLPTLASIHETFGVDHIGDLDFTFGADDAIPGRLATSVERTFVSFIRFHILAAQAVPSESHKAIATLFKNRLVTRILTDNVDNLFSKLDVPFTRTRGVGIFNDPCHVSFDRGEKTLLVIGVAADRRSIVRQARKQGLSVVVVNPEHRVSPKSQSLSYLRARDQWFRMPASTFFRTCCS